MCEYDYLICKYVNERHEEDNNEYQLNKRR